MTSADPVERTSRARIDRIWHPDEGVIGLDVCKIIKTPTGEARTAHTITATAGATPYIENETVYILERDGVTCPPDDIIEPVLATYERWMELNTASALDPTADASELHELAARRWSKPSPRSEPTLLRTVATRISTRCRWGCRLPLS